MVEETLYEDQQTKITEVRKTFEIDGGQITLAPPAKGQFANGQTWAHEHKIELVYGKTVVPIKTKGMYDSLVQTLTKRKVKEFANKLPVLADISELD